MKIFSSLTNRIFFASAALTVLAIAVAVYRVNVAVTAQAEKELERGLHEAATLLEENRTTLFGHLAKEARLVADLPVLKAALDTKDPPTVQPIVDRYQQLIGADLFAVTDSTGRLLGQSGRLRVAADDPAMREAIQQTIKGKLVVSLWPHAIGVAQVVSVPSFIQSELLGTLNVGFSLDKEAAARFKALTNSEIAFAVGNHIQASTLPGRFNDTLARLVGTADVQSITLDNIDYVAVSRALPLGLTTEGTVATLLSQTTAPTAIILRSKTERLGFLYGVHRELGGTALLAVLAATLVSYAIARTVTRPLGAITATMREMAATGDLTRRIQLPGREQWQDEDAQLLATTFNTMTDSIARFQRDASQRERLSSLGRLSTVVAHEIRNPLMIIKTALHALKRPKANEETVRTAVADIDGEVERLNRIVSEVLDFARPIRFDLAPADLNALCQDAVRAIGTDGTAVRVAVEFDRSLPIVVTDAERLRQVLVNVLTNARHAVAARQEPPAGDAIAIKTRRISAERVAIEVRDRGVGIAAEDLPKVFDPYFTTRRTGTGLGLAISRNIIEGLGGTLAVSSRQGQGTDVHIELGVSRAPLVCPTHLSSSSMTKQRS
jgi:signal transduction histidine kinase